MEAKILATFGRVSGLSGLCLGVLLLIFKDVLKNKFVEQLGLDSIQSFSLILCLLIFTFGISSIGVIAWLVSRRTGATISTISLAFLSGLTVLILGAVVYISAHAIEPPPIPPGVRQADSPPILPELPENVVKSFIYFATGQNPGPRYWKKLENDLWSEETDGKATYFKRERRINYGGCDGSVIAKVGDPNFELFIPERSCPNMELKFRRNKENWIGLSNIKDIN